MKFFKIAVIMLAVTSMLGCVAGQMDDVKKSGFLTDYSQLTPGDGDEAVLRYINPNTDFTQYNKVMFERVVVVLSDDAAYKGFDPTIIKQLTDYYQNALVTAMDGGYEVVDQAGPGVLRIRTAVTHIKPGKPVSNAMSTILPVGMALSVVAKAATNDNLGTGEAASEMEAIDSVSGTVVAAAVDRRQGGKSIYSGTWEATEDAFDYWAQTLRKRLDELRSAK